MLHVTSVRYLGLTFSALGLACSLPYEGYWLQPYSEWHSPMTCWLQYGVFVQSVRTRLRDQ